MWARCKRDKERVVGAEEDESERNVREKHREEEEEVEEKEEGNDTELRHTPAKSH